MSDKDLVLGFLKCKLSQIQYRAEMLCYPKSFTLKDVAPQNIQGEPYL